MRCAVTAISTDSSAWIEYLRGTGSAVDIKFQRLVRSGDPLVIPAIVLTEILRGYGDDLQAKRVEQRLLRHPILRHESPDDFVLAAALHRKARRAGHTVRGSIDCLIAASCIRAGSTLLHADADFDRLASCSDLAIYPV